MKNLQSFGVQEMNAKDAFNIDGGFWLGGKLRTLKKLAKYGNELLKWAGVYDAVSDFGEGFSEGNC
jgi:hypothetical protein